MPVPPSFFGNDFKSLESEIYGWDDASEVNEDDLLVALDAVKLWRDRFTDSFTSSGEKIIWRRYESLVWALGESFRRLMLRAKELRGNERVFAAVRFVCRDKQFGKGRESFTMLLGQYGAVPMLVTLSGIVILVKLCHPWNAWSPMLVTGKPSIELGIVTAPPPK